MHLIRAAGAVCLAVVLIAGCRLNEEQQQAEGENTAVTHMKSVPYSNFSLRVSYGDGEHNRYEGIYEKTELMKQQKYKISSQASIKREKKRWMR